MDDDTDGGPRLADLISEPEDVPKIRERVKALAKQARERGEDASVDDFLAQSRKNDAAYIAPVDLEKAEWIADIYEREGRPETHPRNFHYQILGRGYEKRDGEPYTASNSSWTELKEAFKWARIIGLVDSSRILDAANPDPKPTAFDDVDRPLPQSGERTTQDATFGIDVDDGFRSASIPDEIELATGTLWQGIGGNPRVAFRTHSVEAVRSLVATGAGLSVLPDMVYRPWSLEGDRISAVDLAEPLPPVEVGVASRRGTSLSEAAAAFIDLALEKPSLRHR
jgi:hypothetical protein